MLNIAMAKLVVLVLLKIVSEITAAGVLTEDYSWRDFEGSIPPDAFVAGLDEMGNNVYVGQALFETYLMPGQLQNGEVHFEKDNKELTATNNIKILCIPEPQKFEWVKTTYNQGLPNKKIVLKGGYAPYVTTHIGRLDENGVVSVGKVLCLNNENCGLFTTKDGGSTLNTAFEFLTYNPNAPSVSPGPASASGAFPNISGLIDGCKEVSINVFNIS